VHHGKLGRPMSQLGLGCVKTFERAKAIERTFRKLSLRCAEIRKRVRFHSVLEKSFSSFDDFLRFHTARVIYVIPAIAPFPVRTKSGHSGDDHVMP
jgi:hypothetical protein